jgi:hypothetical protein
MRISRLSVGIVTLALLSSSASAGLINIDFKSTANTPSYTGAGIIGSDGQYWNSYVAGSGWVMNNLFVLNTLQDSTGATVAGGSFKLDHGSYGIGDHNAVVPSLLTRPGQGYASFDRLFDLSVSHPYLRHVVTGMVAGGAYDVVLYHGYQGTQAPQYTVNGVTAAFSSANFSANSMVAGRDYVTLNNVIADSNGRIIITTGSGWNSNSGITAIQIEGDLVPAPGAIALLGVAGLMGRRRRN